MSETVADIKAQLGLDSASYTAGLARAKGEADSFGRSATSSIGGGMMRAGGMAARGALMAGAGIGALGALVGVAGIKFDAMKQQSEIAFGTMLHSAKKGKDFVQQLVTFANRTPFRFQGLAQSSQSLLAMGFNAKAIIPTMTAIGDAVAGLGGDAGTLDRVTVALGQIQAKGKASGQEMMQLTENGIPAWKYLAATIGTSIPQAMAQVTKGTVSAKTAIHAITTGMEHDFGGMMNKQSHTFSGLLSTLQDTFSTVAGTVMKPFFNMAVSGMQALVDLVGTSGFQGAVKGMADAAASGFGSVVHVIQGIVQGFQQGGDAVTTFKRALAIGNAGTFGAGIGAGIKSMVGVIRGALPAVKGIIMGIVHVITGNVLPAVAQLAKVFGPLAAQLIQALLPMKPFITNIVLPLFTGLAKSILGTFVVALKIAIPVIAIIARVLGAIGTAAAPLSPYIEKLGFLLGLMFPGAAIKLVGGALKVVGVLTIFGSRFERVALIVGKVISFVVGIYMRFVGTLLGLTGKLLAATLGRFASLEIGVIKYVATMVTQVIGKVVAFVSRFVQPLAALPGKMGTIFGNVASKVMGAIGSLAGRVASAALGVGRAIVDGIINGAGGMMGQLKSSLESGIKGALSSLNPFSPVEHGGEMYIGQPLVSGAIAGVAGLGSQMHRALNDQVRSSVRGLSATVRPAMAMAGATPPPMQAVPVGVRTGGAGGGIVWTGDVVVQGSVVTEQQLVRKVREGLVEIGRRNATVGGLQ